MTDKAENPAPQTRPRVVAAAITYEGVTFSAPAPARHNDVLRKVYALNNGAAIGCDQGFLLDDGRFVTRTAAKALVKRNGQTTIADTHPSELFSEDLW